MKFSTNYSYTNRETKAKYVWLKYQSIIKGRVLDVGADECYLKQYLDSEVEYLGIGKGGSPDLLVDLEKEKIPFPDNSFDCVLCLDVLEHLENIHDVFDELCRVTRKFVIILLPNPWSDFYHMMRFGDYSKDKPMKFYGLPCEYPQDRHKWFFSIEEARQFILYRTAKNGLTVVHMENERINRDVTCFLKRIVISIQLIIARIIKFNDRSIILRKDFHFNNFHESTLWVVLEKDQMSVRPKK